MAGFTRIYPDKLLSFGNLYPAGFSQFIHIYKQGPAHPPNFFTIIAWPIFRQGLIQPLEGVSIGWTAKHRVRALFMTVHICVHLR
jgi:hypothetical protein